MRNYKIGYIFIILLLSINMLNPVTVSAASTAPNLNSEGVVILNSDTGQVVYEKNADQKYFPASTTKVLTALIIIENCSLDEKVTIGKNPPFADGTSIGLREGEVYTVKELLSGLLLMSGNDCAEALAEHLAGSKEAFAELMNKKAKELGATNSNFKNPSGLPDEEHYTTPKDLAIIMNACIKNPTFCEIDKTMNIEFQPSNLDGNKLWISNQNYILLPNSRFYYEYAQYAKKGYTIAAKFTNVVSCTKDNNTFVGAFLRGENADAVYPDATNIFNYVFDNFTNIEIYKKDQEVGNFKVNSETTIPLALSEDIYYTCNKEEVNNIKTTIKYDKPTEFKKKSIKKGDVLSKATIYVNNKEFKTVDLVSTVNREYTPPTVAVSNFFADNNIILSISCLLALGILFTIRIVISKKKEKRTRLNEKYNKLR